MQTHPPAVSRILIAVGFALSCFGLALFLWISFGGPLPLKAKGYEFTVPFDEATRLAVQSDVRISGVNVGKVEQVKLGSDGLAHALIELDDRYAPIPSDTRVILRQKTLLGETYVELTPGSRSAPPLPEGGSLPRAQVSSAVQLDEILRAFDPRTRAAFQAWMQNAAIALRGRGADLSAAIGELPPWEGSADRVLRILDTQSQAVRQLVRGGSDVFSALAERRGQLRGLVENAASVFATTARRNRDLADFFRIMPTFLAESRRTLTRLEGFARLADPLVQQLRPAARQLSPTLVAAGNLAPDLQAFFSGLRRTIAASDPGFPALRRLLANDLPPVLSRYDPYGAQLDPIVTTLKRYRHEITAFLANTAAAVNGATNPAENGFKATRYVRLTNPFSPDMLAVFPRRLKTNRTNPYTAPGGYRRLEKGLLSFETRQCSSGITANLDPSTPSNPNFANRPSVTDATDFFNRLKRYAFNDQLSTDDVSAPPCRQQPPVRSIGVSPEMTRYLHVRREP